MDIVPKPRHNWKMCSMFDFLWFLCFVSRVELIWQPKLIGHQRERNGNCFFENSTRIYFLRFGISVLSSQYSFTESDWNSCITKIVQYQLPIIIYRNQNSSDHLMDFGLLCSFFTASFCVFLHVASEGRQVWRGPRKWGCVSALRSLDFLDS
jgi:hypothetical protein